jgi:hypothetical protein
MRAQGESCEPPSLRHPLRDVAAARVHRLR